MTDAFADLSGRPGEVLNTSLVLASDIHLQHMADKRARLLLDVIARLGPKVTTFVLNGDIFDFCFGDGDYYRRKFRPLGEALSGLATRGVRVIFNEGNHEVHMDHIGWPGVEILTGADFTLELAGGERVRLMHGDHLTQDKAYALFRRVCKAQWARRLAVYVPGAWFDAYSLRHAKYSRAQDQYRKLDHEKVLTAFRTWLAQGDYEHGIIGHFHVPYAEPRPMRSGLMLSVDCWDTPNLLVYDEGQFGRVFLAEPGMPMRVQPVESIFAATPDKP